MAVTRLAVKEAGATLSKYVDRLKPGDRILLCNKDRPVAEIRPLPVPSDQPGPVGLGKGLARIPDSFFTPLPEES